MTRLVTHRDLDTINKKVNLVLSSPSLDSWGGGGSIIFCSLKKQFNLS